MSKVKGFLSSYASHLAGYVVSAATMVSTLDPKLIPPQYSFLTAVAGLVVVAAHNGFSAGKTSAAVSAAANAAAKALTAAAPVLLVGLVLGLGFSVSGCSTAQLAKANAVVTKVNASVTSPAAQPVILAGAFAAVATAEQHGITAAQVNAIAKKALAADSGTGATLSAVGAVVNAELAKLKLPPADLVAAQLVESSFAAYIQGRVGANPTLAQSQAAVADVLQALVTASGG